MSVGSATLDNKTCILRLCDLQQKLPKYISGILKEYITGFAVHHMLKKKEEGLLMVELVQKFVSKSEQFN